jgi:hypothetical protein
MHNVRAKMQLILTIVKIIIVCVEYLFMHFYLIPIFTFQSQCLFIERGER